MFYQLTEVKRRVVNVNKSQIENSIEVLEI